MLYVAYGSNLCRRQMRQRCSNARFIGKFPFKDAKLVFRGVADLEYVPGAITPCGLWNITRDDERSLDTFEGVSGGVYLKLKQEITYNEEKRIALLYIMNSGGIYPPSESYVAIIRQGYRDFGLDESYLDDAVRRSYADKEMTTTVYQRRMRQRSTDKHRELAKKPPELIQPEEGKLL